MYSTAKANFGKDGVGSQVEEKRRRKVTHCGPTTKRSATYIPTTNSLVGETSVQYCTR